MPPEANRDFDIILWGATGFTGQLTAEYLTSTYESSDLELALAGRNREKLEQLEQRLVQNTGGWESLPIVIGDAFDRGSLNDLSGRTSVVCSTVGPYSVYGTDLVEACVENGTDYCDLTGELQWIRRMIDRFHSKARENGARIVHACGFDSVPSDIGTLMVQDHARSNYGSPCSEIKAFTKSSSFSLSGGTLASMAETFKEASSDADVRKVLEAPYSLNPEGERDGPDGSMQKSPRYDDDLDQWTAPFLMAIANEKIVRRSNALLDYSWGQDFRYSESMPTGSNLMGPIKATGISALLATWGITMSLSPLRTFLRRYVLPESGEGPSRDTIENSWFEVRLLGKGTASGEEFQVEGRVNANWDPGYGATSRMLGESAVCLALDDTDTSHEGGILTPASGIGLPLKDRLNERGVSFEVSSDGSN
ncbi:MAG: trans-acting enoyl reductase family protein [bacterium]